jgi:nitrogen regulatory protein P-II 2
MEKPLFQLVTIIADESLRKTIEEEIVNLGASGYTVSVVEGKGKNGARDDAWSGRNIKLETIVPNAIGERILAHLSTKYFNRYAVIVYTFDVRTIRSEHFEH